MKRRKFLTALLAMGAVTSIPIATAMSPIVNDKELRSFNRFFTIANGFAPTQMQQRMFEAYRGGSQQYFRCERQLGMSTFMYTLAQYESKCNDQPVAILAQNSGTQRLGLDRLRTLNINLGNFTGAPVYMPVHSEMVLGRTEKMPLIFLITDADQLPQMYHHKKESYKGHKVFGFGTYENRPFA